LTSISIPDSSTTFRIAMFEFAFDA
jgi:hypothetical protein